MGFCKLAGYRALPLTGACRISPLRTHSTVGSVAGRPLQRARAARHLRSSRYVAVNSSQGGPDRGSEIPPSDERMDQLLDELEVVMKNLSQINDQLGAERSIEMYDDAKLQDIKRSFNECRSKTTYILDELTTFKASELDLITRCRLWLASKYLEVLCATINVLLDYLLEQHQGFASTLDEGSRSETLSPKSLVSQITSEATGAIAEKRAASEGDSAGGLQGEGKPGEDGDSDGSSTEVPEEGAFPAVPDEIPVTSEDIFAQSLATVGCAYLAVYAAEFVGLDVWSGLGWPEHPLQLAQQCLLWSAPAGLATFLFWSYMLRNSVSPAGAVFRKDVNEREAVLNILSVKELAWISLALETSSGIVFRGIGVAAVTLLFAGIPSMQSDDIYIMSAYPGPDLLPHFPTVWQWPFIALGTAAVEVIAYQSSQDGFFEVSRQWVQEQALASQLQAMPIAQLLNVHIMGSEEAEDVIVNQRSFGNISVQWETPLPPEVQTKDWDVTHLLSFMSDFSMRLLLATPSQTYIPLALLVKGTLLSSEAILTGSVWCSIVTAAVMTTAEELCNKDFLAWQASDEGVDLDKPWYTWGSPGVFDLLEVEEEVEEAVEEKDGPVSSD